MTTDAVHSVIGLAAVALAFAGAWLAWGLGYGLLLVGSLLLAGLVYARTR